MQVLTLWTSHPYILITTKKQVKTLEDVKGLKIRVGGGPPTEQMRALGAIPTLIPMPETYLALNRGVIDGMGAPWEAINAFRLYEIVKYYTIVPVSAVYFSAVVNRDKWESLPKDIQAAMTSVSGLEAAKFFGRNFFDTAEDGVMERVKQGSYQMVKYVFPPEAAPSCSDSTSIPPVSPEMDTQWVTRREACGCNRFCMRVFRCPGLMLDTHTLRR